MGQLLRRVRELVASGIVWGAGVLPSLPPYV